MRGLSALAGLWALWRCSASLNDNMWLLIRLFLKKKIIAFVLQTLSQEPVDAAAAAAAGVAGATGAAAAVAAFEPWSKNLFCNFLSIF